MNIKKNNRKKILIPADMSWKTIVEKYGVHRATAFLSKKRGYLYLNYHEVQVSESPSFPTKDWKVLKDIIGKLKSITGSSYDDCYDAVMGAYILCYVKAKNVNYLYSTAKNILTRNSGGIYELHKSIEKIIGETASPLSKQ